LKDEALNSSQIHLSAQKAFVNKNVFHTKEAKEIFGYLIIKLKSLKVLQRELNYEIQQLAQKHNQAYDNIEQFTAVLDMIQAHLPPIHQ